MLRLSLALTGLLISCTQAQEIYDPDNALLPISRVFPSNSFLFDKMYMSFGYHTSDSEPYDDVWSFNRNQGFFRESIHDTGNGELIPSARYGSCTIVWKENLYVFGGASVVDGIGACNNDVWSMNSTDGTWTNPLENGFYNLEDDSLGGRCFHHCMVSDAEHRIYIYGGSRSKEGTSLFNNPIYYDFFTNTLEAGVMSPNTTVPTTRLYMSDAPDFDPRTGSYWLFLGGYDPRTDSNLNDAWILDVGNASSITWTQVSTASSNVALSGHRMFRDINEDRSFYVFGGRDRDQTYSNEVYKINLDDGELRLLDPTSDEGEGRPAARAYFGAGIDNHTESSFIVYGGHNNYIQGIRDMWLFNYEIESWELLDNNEEIEPLDYSDEYWWIWLLTLPLWGYFVYYLYQKKDVLITYQFEDLNDSDPIDVYDSIGTGDDLVDNALESDIAPSNQ